MADREPFFCAEFDGCETHCSYPGEEECHDRNVPVNRCACAACQKARREAGTDAT